MCDGLLRAVPPHTPTRLGQIKLINSSDHDAQARVPAPDLCRGWKLRKKREGGRSELEKRWRTGCETRGCEIRGSGNFRIVSLADLVPHVSSGAFKLLRRGLANVYPIEGGIVL